MKTYRPGTIWITGISASGKTTLGKAIYDYLVGVLSKEQVEFLDGEELRKHLDQQYGYSSKERFEVVKQIVEVAARYNQQHKMVIVSTISHQCQMRDFARSQLPSFLEVYLKCPITVTAQRDYKGHYQKALAGEYEMFVGVTEPYEESESPELTLDTSTLSIEECEKRLLTQVQNRFFCGAIVDGIML